MFYLFKLSIQYVESPPKHNRQYRLKMKNFGHFLLVSLSSHLRSRRGGGRIGQGEGRWNPPSPTALEQNDLNVKFLFRASYTEADSSNNSWPIPVVLKTRIISYIRII